METSIRFFCLCDSTVFPNKQFHFMVPPLAADSDNNNNGPLVIVVLLGWLGAKPRHLRRYAELYSSRGINTVSFVVSVKEVLSLDKGKRLERRVASLSREIESWLSYSDGRQRFLIFHTFSNTGWLTYGSILENLQGKKNILEKIIGCVVDSGGDPDLNPKVWAAGFASALLKKRSSNSVHPSCNIVDEVEKNDHSPFMESMLLKVLDKLFTVLLNQPDINRRLKKKIIDTLETKQPCCPQLYLYSSADKVIPYKSVESFIEDQEQRGKKVFSFNFGTSPHVDHYRTFPETYSSQLHTFLDQSLAQMKRNDKIPTAGLDDLDTDSKK
ncbi:transmembrane protein 53-like [Impatiens glandulifera]|uniref:transmembrane protein 53-like n=1 Tax=Impatiens glandulifera TaxID=253017 RepID=UPI001FB10E96|nr:transmembrane protein 53-like [Impatiens glandulifera]